MKTKINTGKLTRSMIRVAPALAFAAAAVAKITASGLGARWS